MNDATLAATTPALSRGLRSRHVTMISIGGIIGAGLFVGSSAAIAAVGPAVIVSYLLAGVVILFVMRMLAEMVMAVPDAGSFTEYARLGLGHWAGFICGWLYWYFWVVVVGIEAIAGAKILAEWIALPVWQIGLVLLVILTAVNLLSSRTFGEFEFWFASIKVAAIVAFIAIAAAYALGLTSPSGATFANLVAHDGFAPFGTVAVLSGVTTVIFALCGAEIATIAAAESSAPASAISRMTSSIVVRILLFYVLSIALIVMVVPWKEIAPGVSPFVVALQRMHVPGAGLLMSFIVLTAVLSCLNSGLYVTSRVLFTLSAHGDAPRSMVQLNRRKVPARAILIGTSFGYLAVIASIVSPELVFAFLVNASGAIMLIIYLLIAWAQIRLRRHLEQTDPGRLTLKMWWFPWSSWAVILSIGTVLVAMAFTPDLASQLYASLVCLAIAVFGYLALRRRYGIPRPWIPSDPTLPKETTRG
jgi:gamma-aminobutyrate permease